MARMFRRVVGSMPPDAIAEAYAGDVGLLATEGLGDVGLAPANAGEGEDRALEGEGVGGAAHGASSERFSTTVGAVTCSR